MGDCGVGRGGSCIVGGGGGRRGGMAEGVGLDIYGWG